MTEKRKRIRIESFGIRLSTRDCSLSEAELIEMVHHRKIIHEVYMRLYVKALTIETRCWRYPASNCNIFELGAAKTFVWFGYKLRL